MTHATLTLARDALLGWMDQPDTPAAYDASMQRAVAALAAIEAELAASADAGSQQLAQEARRYVDDLANWRETDDARLHEAAWQSAIMSIDRLAALARPAPATGKEPLQVAPVSAQGDEVDARRWQPIETAPRNGNVVILGYEGSHSEEGFWLMDANRNHWGKTGWFASDDDVLCDHPSSPSHWMPLPAPPAARAQQGSQE